MICRPDKASGEATGEAEFAASAPPEPFVEPDLEASEVEASAVAPTSFGGPFGPGGRIFAAEDDLNTVYARDRVLLYTRGMDMPPEHSVELALNALRRAGPGADTHAVMRALQELLRESGFDPRLKNAAGTQLASYPPMNRRPMIPEELDRHPVLSRLKKLARKTLSR